MMFLHILSSRTERKRYQKYGESKLMVPESKDSFSVMRLRGIGLQVSAISDCLTMDRDWPLFKS